MPFENLDHVGGLPQKLRTFLETLVTAFPEITEIWLFGSRAERLPDASDWDLLVRSGDRITPEAVAPYLRFRSSLFEVFIAVGDEFRRPWPRERDSVMQHGSFSRWKWVFNGDGATYDASGGKRDGDAGTKPAVRIWLRSDAQ